MWLEFQDCAGNTESFLRASRPSAADVVLDVLSIDYHETIMAAAGHRAEENLATTVKQSAGQYIAVVEGSIPTGANGGYCTIGGALRFDIAREVCGNAAATIAIGTCAAFGGIPAAAPNPTGALGVADALPGIRNLINLPACPANAENLTALLVHYLTFKTWPPSITYRRPLFAYGKPIHDNCERRAHFDAGQYVEAWGDAGHRAGYCLYKMGCKGPVTYQNCPNVRWNEAARTGRSGAVTRASAARTGFLGSHDAVLPAPARHPRVRRRDPTSTPSASRRSLGVGAAFAGHGLMQITKRVGNRAEPIAPKPNAPPEKGDAS